MSTFGTKLKIYRAKNNLQGIDLAKILGVPKQTISTWENSSSKPYEKRRREIESILKLPENFLEDDYTELPKNILYCVGYATAGLLETQYQQDLGYIEVPEKYAKKDKYICVKVSGDSMDKILLDNGYAVFDRYDHNYLNKPILVEVNNETTIKYYSDTENMIILTPKSNNPIHQPIYIEKSNIENLKIYGTLVWYSKEFN